MPNGRNRIFVRFLRCLETFRSSFDKWPTKITLDPDFIEELHEVFTPEDFKKFGNKMEIISKDVYWGDGTYIAEDDEGNMLDLISAKFIFGDYNAMIWLGIDGPDYG